MWVTPIRRAALATVLPSAIAASASPAPACVSYWPSPPFLLPKVNIQLEPVFGGQVTMEPPPLTVPLTLSLTMPSLSVISPPTTDHW